MRKHLTYAVREVAPYINWIYYFHAWGMEPRFASVENIHNCPSCRASWISSFPADEQAKAREAAKLYDEATELLRQWADEHICHALFLLTKAYSEGDNIIVDDKVRIPFLRQQHVGRAGYTLCLSDFIREELPPTLKEGGGTDIASSTDIANTIGIFSTTVSKFKNIPPSSFDLQSSTLADRLAEATAEKMHEEVRKHYWGYANDECLTMRELHEERFQGIRPAVGYPSLPDQSINHLIDKLLSLTDIDITLSDNGAMNPPCSVSGFMFAHPQARYFAVGNISDEQLTDYAHRRDIPRQQATKFLASIIGHQEHTNEGV